jgi:hypothetical protein
MKIDKQKLFNKFPIKKSPRMNEELQNIYHSLPAGQKSLIFNQILASFLKQSNETEKMLNDFSEAQIKY